MGPRDWFSSRRPDAEMLRSNCCRFSQKGHGAAMNVSRSALVWGLRSSREKPLLGAGKLKQRQRQHPDSLPRLTPRDPGRHGSTDWCAGPEPPKPFGLAPGRLVTGPREPRSPLFLSHRRRPRARPCETARHVAVRPGRRRGEARFRPDRVLGSRSGSSADSACRSRMLKDGGDDARGSGRDGGGDDDGDDDDGDDDGEDHTAVRLTSPGK